MTNRRPAFTRRLQNTAVRNVLPPAPIASWRFRTAWVRRCRADFISIPNGCRTVFNAVDLAGGAGSRGRAAAAICPPAIHRLRPVGWFIRRGSICSIRAFAHHIAPIARSRWCILGEGPERASLERLAARMRR